MLVSARLAEKRPTNYNIIIADSKCELLRNIIHTYIFIHRQTHEIIVLYYIQSRRIASILYEIVFRSTILYNML